MPDHTLPALFTRPAALTTLSSGSTDGLVSEVDAVLAQLAGGDEPEAHAKSPAAADACVGVPRLPLFDPTVAAAASVPTSAVVKSCVALAGRKGGRGVLFQA